MIRMIRTIRTIGERHMPWLFPFLASLYSSA